MKKKGYTFYFRNSHFLLIIVFILLAQSCDIFENDYYYNDQKYDRGYLLLKVDQDGKAFKINLFKASMVDDPLSYELQAYNDNSLVLINKDTYSFGYIISTKDNRYEISDLKQFTLRGNESIQLSKQSSKWAVEEINQTILFPNSTVSITNNEKSDLYEFTFEDGELVANKTFTLQSKFIGNSTIVTYKFKEHCEGLENTFYFTEQVHTLSTENLNQNSNSVQKSEREVMIYFDPTNPEKRLIIPINDQPFDRKTILSINGDYVIQSQQFSNLLEKVVPIDDGYILSTFGDNNRLLGVFDDILVTIESFIDIKTTRDISIINTELNLSKYSLKGYNMGNFIFFFTNNNYETNHIYKFNKETNELTRVTSYAYDSNSNYSLYDDIFEPIRLTNGTRYLLVGESQRKFGVNY